MLRCAYTSTYYGNVEITSLGRSVTVRDKLGGRSFGHLTLWQDRKGGLWARRPHCKGSALGPYRPVAYRLTKNGYSYYFA